MAGRVSLDDSVQFIRGVGPVRAKTFARLGVSTIADLIEYFPFRYELKPKSQPIGSLDCGVTATIVGEVARVRSQGRFHRSTLTARVVDGTGECHVRWFNSSYLADRIGPGRVVRLTGKVDQYRELASFTNPQTTIVEPDEDPLECDLDRYEPVYPATEELPSRQIARVIRQVLDEAAARLPDYLPAALRERRGLPPRKTAILRYHRPTSAEDVPVARRRLAYDELLLCQLAVQLARRARRRGPRAVPIEATGQIDERIRQRFPFALTPGQDRAIGEIRGDLAKLEPMNRLLQGDVGAGKTAVAVYAALAAIAKRRQVAMLAPTEVLASQHRGKVERYLDGSRVRTAYLAGSTTKAARRRILSSLGAGEVDLLIGTHAVLEPDVAFKSLGLVIIDEQHKFGVAQRAALRQKGAGCHCLVLTATPIPRTLAMTVFGDLDVSTIQGVLPGRQPITTRLVSKDRSDEAWAFVRSRLDRGEQAYVVYPLVEDSEQLPLKSAKAEADRLSRSTLLGCRVGLLHGRMRAGEKAEVMDRFRSGEIQVLVSTTVIEVGVDVPNATLMVIQHAERYGLSQLHQLRGRIGRGTARSYCLLLSDSTEAATVERLRILCETNDGFRIAEEDLRLRGPGELLGTRQHGLPTLKVADLVEDIQLLSEARDDAADLLREDERLASPGHAALRRELLRQYGSTLALVDVA